MWTQVQCLEIQAMGTLNKGKGTQINNKVLHFHMNPFLPPIIVGVMSLWPEEQQQLEQLLLQHKPLLGLEWNQQGAHLKTLIGIGYLKPVSSPTTFGLSMADLTGKRDLKRAQRAWPWDRRFSRLSNLKNFEKVLYGKDTFLEFIKLMNFVVNKDCEMNYEQFSHIMNEVFNHFVNWLHNVKWTMNNSVILWRIQ